MFRFTVLLLTATASLALRAGPPAVEGVTFVRTVGGISEYLLPANDLNVLLLEDHSAPVLTFMVTFRVGSRHEVTGTTGATHLLEHLMFKGSEKFNPGNGQGFDTLMDRVGGINNATTWLDRTNYYENLPSDQLELAVQLEADRMRHLLLREADRQPEMTVVRNEFEREENDPAAALDKEVNAAAFLAHPYHHPVIGWRSDIEQVPIAKLREFYDTFYWPNNATISVIGDFQPATALRLIQQAFGVIPRSPHPIPQIYTAEPAQTGPRRVTVKRPGEVGAIQIAFKTCSARHADHAPLEMLAAVLGTGKTSRLYRTLIDPNLALQADASLGFFHDASLFNVSALLAPGVTPDQVEQVVRAQIDRVRQDGVTPAEVTRALNQLLAGIAYGRDGSFAIAGDLNEAIAVGDWTLYSGRLEQLRQVTPADIQRVARTYLNEDQSTTGWFIPLAATPGKSAGLIRRAGPTAVSRSATRGPHYYRDPDAKPVDAVPPPRSGAGRARDRGAPPAAAGSLRDEADALLIAPKVRRRTLAGLDVLTLRTAIADVVTLRGVINAGDVFNPPGNSAIADLAAGMLDQGTVPRDKFAVAEVLEQTGATLNFGTGSHTLNFSGKCLRKDLPLLLGLLAEQLRTPRFDPAEFAKLKQQLAGRYQRNLEDPDFRAQSALARALFPAGHPNRPPASEEYLADIASATLDQVRAFHAASYGPRGARLVAVGDLDDAALDRALAEAFAGWQGGRAWPEAAPAPPLAAGRIEKVGMPGKTSVSLFIGQPSGLHYRDSDHLPLELATAVLGSGFFSARLLDIIRNREGLTYSIGAALAADTYADGSWVLQASFAPELLEKGLASTRRELRRFCAEGLGAEELARFKVTLTGSYKVALATTGGLAGTLLNALQRGHGPEWVDDYPSQLQALPLAEVNAAIRRRLDPDRMVTVLAGSLPPDLAK